MSYPGESGFSLSERELEANQDLSVFLSRCVAYGVLESFRHTAKSKHRGQSRKWYPFPILAPYFQVPHPSHERAEVSSGIGTAQVVERGGREKCRWYTRPGTGAAGRGWT